MAIEIGQQVLHYRLIEKIGEGGMGVVWKAEDTRLHRQVALKFVPEERAQDLDAVDRHLREARAASALNHPNICSIHDIGEWEGRRFIVLELIEGQPLDRHIGGKPMDVDTAVDIAIEIADALDAAHSKGIIHRDIKAANIVLTNRGRAKMLDFGLAKLTSEMGGSLDEATRMTLDKTTPGTVVGTVSYMSPEQALGKELDSRTDIFSLGVVLYEMLTGRRAFKGDTSAAVFDAILNRAPTTPIKLNSKVSGDLERIVNKALEKDPDLRYQGAADLRADLKRLRRDSSTERTAVTPTPSAIGSMPRWLRFLGAAAALVIVVLIAHVLREKMGSEVTSKAQAPGVYADERTASSSGPSIAVLPFTNSSGDPDQEFFSDGLTEDIITELSRYPELSVIARYSTARYKGRDIAIPEIGDSLGARYILQGTVRKSGQRIRVGVQLSDSDDGRSVWGTNYERDLTARDLFKLQDELTQQVVNEIAGSYGALTRAELPGARRKPPASLDSYDCVLRVYEYLQVHTGENHLAARDCLEGVIEIDPDYVEGRAWLAYLYADQYHHRWNERPGEYNALDRSLQIAEEAVRLDDANYVAHGALALAHFFRGESERGKIEAYRAIELNPNNAVWLALLGNYLTLQEDFEQGVEMARKAIELNPHPPAWVWNAILFDLYFHGRYEEALVLAKEREIGDFRSPMFVAAAYGQLGRPADAAAALEEMQVRWSRPLAELRRELIERHAFSPRLTDLLLEGLAKAGLEGAMGGHPDSG